MKKDIEEKMKIAVTTTRESDEIQNNKAINIEQSSSKLNTNTNNNNINNSNSLYMLNPITNTNTNTKPNSSSLNVQTSLNSISSNTKQTKQWMRTAMQVLTKILQQAESVETL